MTWTSLKNMKVIKIFTAMVKVASEADYTFHTDMIPNFNTSAACHEGKTKSPVRIRGRHDNILVAQTEIENILRPKTICSSKSTV